MMKLRKFVCVALASALMAGGISILNAQSPGAAAANEAAYGLFAAGDYPGAAAAYEKLVKDYATDAVVPTARIQLAFCYYFMADQDKALAELDKLTKGPPLPPELAQVAASFLPQVLSAKAASLPADDAKRKATFEEAVKKFTEFLEKYPQAPEVESMAYGRAIANYQLGKYAEVVSDLESNLQKFANSPTILDSQNLLALTLATEASMEMMKKDAADQAKAASLYKRATDYLRDIINRKTDLTLVNDANFQLGEVLFNQAAYTSDEAAKKALLQQAREAYSSIFPKEDMIKLQEQKLASFPDRLRQAIRVRDERGRKLLEEQLKRERLKLGELQSRPDQVATAMVKTGEIYFTQNDLNKARVLLGHVTPFLTNEDDQKRALYFNTLTYALQNQAQKATEGYNAFQEKYKGDPIAANLPLAMGNLYLNHPDPAINNPTRAVDYFKESLAIYPDGPFAAFTLVTQATALQRLGDNEGALKTFQDFLKGNPAPEIGVLAQNGLATIYKDTAQWDQAIAAYQELIEKYPTTPQATEAAFWIAVSTQQKGDNAAAIPQLQAFIEKNPDHALIPTALYALAGAQIGTNAKADGIQTLAELAEKFPESQPAPFTYFMRAQLLAPDGKAEEVVALMKQFIEKYPQDEKVFFAYDSIAQDAAKNGRTAEAIATYNDFVEKYPTAPKAPEALLRVVDFQRALAESLAINYTALEESKKPEWKDNVQASVSTAQDILSKYPDSPEVANALRSLLTAQRMLVSAQLKSPEEVENYFQELAESAQSPAAKSKVLFTLASYLSESDKAKGMALMEEAYDPSIIYSPQDMDAYGLVLIEGNKLDAAAQVFDKLAADYPNPPNTAPNQAPLPIQQAQAIALFGKGSVAQAKGETATAGQLFEQLKQLYPWSPKVMEANYGIAEALKAQKQYEQAINLLTGIIRATTADTELRAKSMLLGGYIMVDRANETSDEKLKAQFEDAAIDYFIKIATFYAGVPKISAEGLWQGGQLLEKQNVRITDPAKKKQQMDKARAAYQQLVKEFPNSEFAPKAQERLSAIATP